MNDERLAAIEERLTARFSPTSLRVKDQSNLHAGHVGARDGRGHFEVMVVSTLFAGRSRLQRHRDVYDCLSDLLESDIHALRIKAYSPEEFAMSRPE